MASAGSGRVGLASAGESRLDCGRMRAAICARVSTFGQEPENQFAESRRSIAARTWTPAATEYIDRGIGGAKDRRPALDRLLADAKRRRFDVLVVWRLDRLGRNLRRLIILREELRALGVALVSLGEGIDATTPAGKLQMHTLGVFAEFERSRIAERVKAGLQRARAQGKRLGRPRRHAASIPVPGGTVRSAASAWGVSRSTKVLSPRFLAGSRSPCLPAAAGTISA